MRYICLVVLLIGQLSNAQISSSTDGTRKLKLSSAWKAIDTQLFYRSTNTPSSDPTAGIDEESPEEPVDDQTASEQPEKSVPTDEESDSSQVDSGDKPDSTEESKEPVYPTLGKAATYNDSDENASKAKKPEDPAAEKAEDTADEKAEDPADEKAEDPADEKAEDTADENSEDPDTDKKEKDELKRTVGAPTESFCGAGAYETTGFCLGCPAGTYSLAGDAICTPCADGHSSPAFASSCTACLPGYYSSQGSACLQCASGSFATDKGSATCSPCPNGSFSPPGASSCSACSACLIELSKCLSGNTSCSVKYNSYIAALEMLCAKSCKSAFCPAQRTYYTPTINPSAAPPIYFNTSSPTTSPTMKIAPVIQVTQRISGLSAATASASQGFKTSFANAVATTLKITPDKVRIEKIRDVKTEKIQLMETPSNSTEIEIDYNVQSSEVSIATLSASISGAVSSGEFTNTLQSALIAENVYDIRAAASVVPTYTDISPTASPTPAPSFDSRFPFSLPTMELSQIVNGISAREAKSSMYFKQDFAATVVYILGTSVEADAITILDITDALTKSMKRQLLLTSSVKILYLLPVQDVSRSAALQALTTASEDGSFASYFNVQLSSHGVPNRVSVAAPLQTDKNPTPTPTNSPVRESVGVTGLSPSTIGLIVGCVCMGVIVSIAAAFGIMAFFAKMKKRKALADDLMPEADDVSDHQKNDADNDDENPNFDS